MDAYTILGISKNASNNEIRKAYIELAKKYHPDKFVNENDKKVAEDRFKEINEAYYELKELKRDVEATHEDNIRKAEKPKPKPEPTTYKSATGWFEHIKNSWCTGKKQKESTRDNTQRYKDFTNIKDCIFKRKDGTIVFLFRDYSIHQIGEEKLQKRTVLLIKNGVEYEYDIYTDIDISRMLQDDKYREHFVENIFDNEKLQKVSETLYGYLGKTQQKWGRYTQASNYKSMEILRQKAFLEEYRIQRDESTTIGLRKLYKQIQNGEELNAYSFTTYSLENGIVSRNIKSNISFDRMEVNEPYRSTVVNSYLTKKEEYIGNPEQDYRNKTMKMKSGVKSKEKLKEPTFIKINTTNGSILFQDNKPKSGKTKVIINGNSYNIFSNIEPKKILTDRNYLKLVVEMLTQQNVEAKCIKDGGYIGHVVKDGNGYKVVEDKRVSSILSEYARANAQVYKENRDLLSIREIGQQQDGKGIFVVGKFDEKNGLKQGLIRRDLNIEKMQQDLIYRKKITSSLYEEMNKMSTRQVDEQTR